MDGSGASSGLWLGKAALNRLMPLHLLVDETGVTRSHGPTLSKLFPGEEVVGRPLADILEIKGLHPAGIAASSGRKLRLVRQLPEISLRLKGLLVPVENGWLLNLSFGVDLPRAVAALQLTISDFAATGLATELLYLAEANVAVTGELRGLAQRLDSARHRASEEALTDTLTGLRNRRACDSILDRFCREGTAFGLMHMDLDFFKAVNDTLGHAAGDHVLMHVASVLKANARVQDCIARVGGDEFVLLLPGMTEQKALAQFARRVIRLLQRPIPFQEHECRISASFGYLVVMEGEGRDPAQALADADVALYAAKKAGRGRAVAYGTALHDGGVES